MALRNLSPDRQSNTWVPTLTAGANVAAVVFINGFYSITGDVVHCFLEMTVDPTVITTPWTVRASLPVGVDLAATGDLIGTAGVLDSGGLGGAVTADTTNNEANIDSQNLGAGVETIVVQFGYRVP